MKCKHGMSDRFEDRCLCGAVRFVATGQLGDLRLVVGIRNTLVAARVSYADKSLAWGHGFQAHVGPMRSHTRGWVRLASADLAEAPHIRFKDRTGPESTGSPTSGCESHTSFTRGPTTASPSNLPGSLRDSPLEGRVTSEPVSEMGFS